MSLVVPALVLAGTFVSTYFFCVRPMRRGGCAMSLARPPRSSHHDRGTGSLILDADLIRARRELASLRERTEAGGPRESMRPSDTESNYVDELRTVKRSIASPLDS